MDKKIDVPSEVELSTKSLLYRLPLIFIGLGVAAFIFCMMDLRLHPDRGAFGYLFGYTVVLSVVLGCLYFVIVQHLTRAGWSVVIRRIPESAIATLPLFLLLFLPIVFGMHELFPWSHVEHLDHNLAKKAGYLNIKFFLIRAFAYLVSWSALGFYFYKVSVSQDFGRNAERTRRLWALSAPAIFLYAVTVTFASFDWLMSLQPHWYSTIFGVCFFAGCVLAGQAFITLMCMALQASGALKNSITPEHYHDMGKLMFGWIVFWAYVNFSQFMLYWYGAIPEEVEFYYHRLHHGWAGISYALPVIHFCIPLFTLMSRALKRVKLVLALNCIWILLVHIVNIYWLILPNYGAHGETGEIPHMKVELIDVVSLFGLFSLFFGSFLFVLVRGKVACVGDPRMKESLAFENF